MNKEEKRKVLVIDDSLSTTYQIRLILTKIGFEVVSVNNKEAALNAFGKGDFGYVVMDLFIPDKNDGFELLTNLNKLIFSAKMNTKVIVMSGAPKGKYKLECENLGADNYIEKNESWQDELVSYCK